MTRTDLGNLDLNLLITLDALLTERSVTRAAHRLGVSQPTVSVALQRLRRHFGDALLARVGNRSELTPLATQLATLVPGAVAGVRRVFEARDEFDPLATEHEFTVVASDYAAIVLGDHLATVLEERAPRARLRFVQQQPSVVDDARETLRRYDGMILPTGFVSDLPRAELYEDTWVCVVDAELGVHEDEFTLESLRTLPWVVAYHRPTAFTAAVQQLRHLGIEPKGAIVVESFLTVPFLVAGTRRVAVLQARLAERLAAAAGVRVLPCPWEAGWLTESFWWHPSREADPAHRWLREVVVEAGRRVAEAGGVPQRGSRAAVTSAASEAASKASSSSGPANPLP